MRTLLDDLIMELRILLKERHLSYGPAPAEVYVSSSVRDFEVLVRELTITLRIGCRVFDASGGSQRAMITDRWWIHLKYLSVVDRLCQCGVCDCS